MHGDIYPLILVCICVDHMTSSWYKQTGTGTQISSSDVSEHVEVWCYTLFSGRLVARVQITSIVASAVPCSIPRSRKEGEASPEPECFICSCAYDCLLVWAEGDVENTIFMA